MNGFAVQFLGACRAAGLPKCRQGTLESIISGGRGAFPDNTVACKTEKKFGMLSFFQS